MIENKSGYAGGGREGGPRVRCRQGRRRFLKQLAAGAAAIVGSQAVASDAHAEPADQGSSEPDASKMPAIKIGRYAVSRLVAGSNPIGGYSHSTLNLARHMQEYFTLDRTVEFISRCEQYGINTWQSGHGPNQKVVDALRTLRERGSRIQWLCLAWEGRGHKPVSDIVGLRPIAIVHHGGVTDSLFRTGQGEKVHDFVKKIHDAGVLAGISAHNPANIAHAEEKGWENDFFMTCFYHISRPAEEIRAKLGTVPLGEPFLESDPDEMTAVVRQVKRPCLGFKILAAGRLCWHEPSVESAFKYAFSHIKKTDGVIVGMYPKFSDEIGMNVRLTLKYGKPG